MKIKRLAVALFFFTNGFQYANWVARLPEVEKLYNISHATLGTLLLCSAAGAMAAMPFAGYLTVLFGSRRITIFTGALMVALIPFIATSSEPPKTPNTKKRPPINHKLDKSGIKGIKATIKAPVNIVIRRLPKSTVK